MFMDHKAHARHESTQYTMLFHFILTAAQEKSSNTSSIFSTKTPTHWKVIGWPKVTVAALKVFSTGWSQSPMPLGQMSWNVYVTRKLDLRYREGVLLRNLVNHFQKDHFGKAKIHLLN